ncbi:unnamed protein product [Amoebophrya sp. A120]|nr:unnamed protein product [Amoebophrya sp. A120]|eukprot:GSA120T00022063001.1
MLKSRPAQAAMKLKWLCWLRDLSRLAQTTKYDHPVDTQISHACLPRQARQLGDLFCPLLLILTT